MNAYQARTSRSAGLATAVLLTVLAAQGCTRQNASEQTSPPLYAYRTANELVVMRGTAVITKEPVAKTPDHSGVAWTIDGRYIGFIAENKDSQPDPDKRSLVSIDVTSGTIRRVSCPNCRSAAPIEKSSLLVSREDNFAFPRFTGMLRFDLAGNEPPVASSTQLPPLTNVLLLGGAAGQVVLVGLDQEIQETYYRLAEDGSTTALGTQNNRADSFDGTPLLRGFGPDATVVGSGGTSIVVTTGIFKPRNSLCGESTNLYAATEKNGLFDVNTSSFYSTSYHLPGDGDELIINDLWWDQAEHLHAIVVTGTCKKDSLEPKTLFTEWQYVDGKWTQKSSERLLSARDFPGARVVVVRQGESNQGVLYFEQRGTRQRLADNAVLVTAPTVKVPTGLPPDVCPVEAGLCLSSRAADIDNDGRPDPIGLLYNESLPLSAGSASTKSLSARARLSKGGFLNQRLQASMVGNTAKLIGTTDVNGDGRQDLFVTTSAGAHGATVGIYEYLDGKLQPLRSDFGGSLSVDSSISSIAGFSCTTQNGVAQLISILAGQTTDSQRYEVEQVVYKFQDGVMRRASSQTTTYPANLSAGYATPPKAVNDLAGARCGNLPRFLR